MKRLLAKVLVALALGLLVLLVLDGYNPTMAFLTSTPSKVYIIITCVAGIVLGILCLAERSAERSGKKNGKTDAMQNTI